MCNVCMYMYVAPDVPACIPGYALHATRQSMRAFARHCTANRQPSAGNLHTCCPPKRLLCRLGRPSLRSVERGVRIAVYYCGTLRPALYYYCMFITYLHSIIIVIAGPALFGIIISNLWLWFGPVANRRKLPLSYFQYTLRTFIVIFCLLI